MKKVLFLILASFLVLAACGNKEEDKSEDKKETKSSDKVDKKKEESKKSNDDKKEKSDKEDTNKKEDSTTDDTQQANNEQQTEAVEQPQSIQEPTEQEKMEANAKVAKQHGFTGIPNGDAGMLDENTPAYSNNQLDPETGLPNDDGITIHEDGRKTYKDELGHDKNILTPEDEARQAEENDITPEERAEVEASLNE